MDRFERRAQAIMERGDRIIADRQKKNTMIRRISFSVSGLCAAALIVIGIWKSPALHRVPEIPQLPETVTTEAAETTAAATDAAEAVTTAVTEQPDERTTKTAERPVTETERGTSPASVTTAAVYIPETVPAETEAPAAAPAVDTPLTSKVPEVPTVAPTAAPAIPEETESDVSDEEPCIASMPADITPDISTEASTQPPTQAPVYVTDAKTTAAVPVTTKPSEPDEWTGPPDSGHQYLQGEGGTEMPTAPGNELYVYSDGIYHLPASADDRYGIRTLCRKLGYKEIAPEEILDGFRLTDITQDESGYAKLLQLVYTRKNRDGNADILTLNYEQSRLAELASKWEEFSSTESERVRTLDANGYEFRYYYNRSIKTLLAIYTEDDFRLTVRVDGLTEHGAKSILASVS